MGVLDNLFGNDGYTLDDIVSFIEDELIVKKTQYTTEKNVENVIFRQLKDEFDDVHQQYNIGGHLGLKCDIDLFNGGFGIELKLAKELKSATNVMRSFGQAIYYSKLRYNEDLIMLVVGTSGEYSQTIKEMEQFMEDLGITFIYKKIK